MSGLAVCDAGADPHAADQRLSWRPRALLAACVLLAAVAGAVVSRDAASVQAARAAGPELVRLLQAMAALKAVMAIGAVWLIDWRLRYAARPAVAGSYILAAALMAAAPGVMFHLAHVIAGGVLFHAGLALLVVLGCTDRVTAREMLTRMVPSGTRRQVPQGSQVTTHAQLSDRRDRHAKRAWTEAVPESNNAADNADIILISRVQRRNSHGLDTSPPA